MNKNRDKGYFKLVKWFSETPCEYMYINEFINNKILHTLEHNMNPILCIGENLKQFKEKKTIQVLEKQILQGLKNVKLNKIYSTISILLL